MPRCYAISTTATEVLGTTRPSQWNGWFDAECQRATDEKNRSRSRMLTAATRQNMQRFCELRTVEKKLHWRKKREHGERILAEAERSFARNDARKYYKPINSTRKKATDRPTREHYNRSFGSGCQVERVLRGFVERASE